MNNEIDVPKQVKILQSNPSEREKNAASNLLVERFKQSLYFYILKLVYKPEAAQDITQQAWAKAFHKIHLHKDTNAFSTWLFKIALNVVIDTFRKKTLDTVSLDAPLNMPIKENDQMRPREVTKSLVDTYPIGDELIHLQLRKETCQEVIGMLSPKFKELIEMKYLQELSYEEIVKKTGLPLGTVKGNLFRAKKKMGTLIQEKKSRVFS